MEPRARATRHKGSLNFGPEIESMLYGFGAPMPPAGSSINPKPNSETVRVLDEILTDFIIETCHGAVAIASYAGRTKLKLEDFQWVIKGDPNKVGRVKRMFEKDRVMKDIKKLGGLDGGGGAGDKLAIEDMAALAEEVGEEGTGKGKGRGRGRGRRKKREIAQVDGAGDDDDDEDDDAGRSVAKKPRSARSETG